MVGGQGDVNAEALVEAILSELNDFIDPPMTTGIGISPDDRLWLAQRVAKRIVRCLGEAATRAVQHD